jgi:hypothetical protein
LANACSTAQHSTCKLASATAAVLCLPMYVSKSVDKAYASHCWRMHLLQAGMPRWWPRNMPAGCYGHCIAAAQLLLQHQCNAIYRVLV